MSEFDEVVAGSKSAKSGPADGAQGDPETQTKADSSPPRARSETKRGQCSRWMHHRKGEYCKTCSKMQ